MGCVTGLVTLIAERPDEVADLVERRLPRNGSTELLRELLRKTGDLLLLMGTVGNMMMGSD
jgi:hypothetical protein